MKKVTDLKEKINYDTVRLPRDFIPEAYNVDFYIDYKNIKYEITSEIMIRVDNEKAKVIILNANLKDYQIKSIKFLECTPKKGYKCNQTNLKYFTLQDISKLFSGENLKSVFHNCVQYEDDMKNVSESEKLVKLNEKLKYYYPCLFYDYKNLFERKDFQLINFLEDKDKKIDSLNIIEESIYIPIYKYIQYKKGDKFKLVFKVEGKIPLSTERKCGLYFSLFGHDLKLLENQKNFYKIWEDDTKNENLIKNSVFTVVNEPVDARCIFPCFDEPSFKSKFNVKISVDKKYKQISPETFKVVSNGDLETTEERNDKVIYKFSESPLMSVYLLTFVIGHYDFIESYVGKTRLRVYTPVGCMDEGTFAEEVARKSLDFYQNYFEIPYSFPKLDLVPVPAMEYRALEDWGCIVFLNYALLVNKLVDIKERKNIARTIVHEISHMWFGNLVTMEWWDDIWLNEGFARFMEFYCLDCIKPEWEIWSKFIELIFERALEIDERPRTHPVRCEVPKPREVMNIFDTISYSKGSSLIRMLFNYVGKDKFRQAIIKYMQKYQYKNTTTENLWQVFKETINFDVEPLMHSWLNLSGHPALEVDLKQEKGDWVVIFTQSPYPQNYNKIDPIWKIPLFFRTKKEEFTFLMEEKTFSLSLKKINLTHEELFENTNFIKVNNDMKGFYRVFYKSNILLNTLIQNSILLTKYDVAGLLSDYISSKDFATCLTILNAAKPIDNFIVLFYSKKIYDLFKEHAFQYTCFKELLMKDEENYKSKYEELVNIQDKVKEFYFDLIAHQGHDEKFYKKNILKKIYLNSPSESQTEDNDELHNLVLYFYTFIKKDQEVITHIVENFETGHPNLHKNLKYVVYSTIVNYSHNVLKDEEKELEFFEKIYDEFVKNFFELSLQSQSCYVDSLVEMEDASENLIDYFSDKFLKDTELRHTYFSNTNLFSSTPNNRWKFLQAYVKSIKANYDLAIDWGEATWDEVLSDMTDTNNCFKEFFYLFQDLFDEDLKEKLKNYIVEELRNHNTNPDVDVSDEQFKEIIKLTRYGARPDYCNTAKKIVSEILDYFKKNK